MTTNPLRTRVVPFRRPLVLAATGAVVSLSAAACGSTHSAAASAPGVTPTSVLVGSDQPLTGEAAPGYDEIAPASNAFFEYVNTHRGVNGRSIKYAYLDDNYSPTSGAKAVSDEQQLIDSDHVFAYFNGFGVVSHAAVVDALNSQHVPDLFVGSSCACWNQPAQHPYTFGFGTNYSLEGRLIGNYVAGAFPGAKIAEIYEKNPIACCQQAVAQLNQEIPAAQVVTRQPFTTKDLLPPTLLQPQLRAAQASGAQVLIIDTLSPQAIAETLLQDLRLGYHPTLIDPFPLSADPTTVGTLITRLSHGRQTVAIENGLITQSHLPSPNDTNNPWIRLFRQIHDAYEPEAPFDGMTVYGMSAAATFVQALQAAGRNPTRASIVAAINGGAVNHGGPGITTLKDSPTDHDSYPGVQVGFVQDGQLTLGGRLYYAHPNGNITTQPPTPTPPPSRF